MLVVILIIKLMELIKNNITNNNLYKIPINKPKINNKILINIQIQIQIIYYNYVK